MPRRYRIGAVHALTDSIEPTQAAFKSIWAQADVAHLMDGSLYLDRSAGTADEAEIARRVENLIRHSASTGAEGILFTGSFFGAAVRQASHRVAVPVLTSFQGLIARAFELDRPLYVLSTAADSTTLLLEELRAEASKRGVEAAVAGHAIEGALEALLSGDFDRHDRLVVDAVSKVDQESAVVIAQFSMERALPECIAATASPVIGPAHEAVRFLRGMLAQP